MRISDSKRIFGFSREEINEYICPWLLACSVCFSCFYTFNKITAYIVTAFFAAEAAVLFRFFGKLRQKKSGAFIYSLIFGAVVIVSLILAIIHSSAYGYYSPERWFYGLSGTDGFQPLLLAALYIGGGFFIISVIYYFTMVRFRMMGIMLCIMFPFFFFSKRSDTMPDIMTTAIVLIFLATIIHNKKLSIKDKDGYGRLQVDRAYIICFAVFIIITGAITMAADKPFYESFLERNEELLSPFSGMPGTTGFEELSDQSSPRNARPKYKYEKIFYLETDSDSDELFLRTKAFDYFNGDVWVNSGSGQFFYYSQQKPEYSTDDVVSDICALTGKGKDGLYTNSSARAFDDDFRPLYLPAPYGTITDDLPVQNLIYRKSGLDTSISRGSSYYYADVLDDSFRFYEAEAELTEYAKKLNFSTEEYLVYLSSQNDREEAKRLIEDYYKARELYTGKSGISDRLEALAKEITADCHSDLEKAQKLESYFTENGFIYSLDYVPRDNSIDYFVFESKTGYCASYATAMTLMARAAGLPARYVEGFAAFEKNEEGQIVIRDGYAHAFVEVYIPGAGWMTFDPTVSGYMELPDGVDGENNLDFLSRLFNTFNRLSFILIVLAALVIFALFDRIKELFLRLTLKSKTINERIIILYANLIKITGISAGTDLSAYTPNMMRKYLVKKKGVVPEKLISLFEKTVFGAYECSPEELKDAYREYKESYRQIRRPLRDKK
ncbi:MAG: transglutaminase-like domain-containing protein [Clostridiales bacterium]|nr:transglutaminase-like domain-containing protein [Clostridiales bacterium]